jgi:hypothetical protein
VLPRAGSYRCRDLTRAFSCFFTSRVSLLCALQTIALIAVREGVVQLGSMKKVCSVVTGHFSDVARVPREPRRARHQHVRSVPPFARCEMAVKLSSYVRLYRYCRRVVAWLRRADALPCFACVLDAMLQVAEDLSYVVMLRRKFGYLESIPGVLLPHPSSAAAFPGGCGMGPLPPPDLAAWAAPGLMPPPHAGSMDPYGGAAAASMHIMPSMSSLEALLSKLPSVVPAPPQPPPPSGPAPTGLAPGTAKEEMDEYVQQCHHGMDVAPSSNGGESSSASAAASMSSYFVDVGGKPGEGF